MGRGGALSTGVVLIRGSRSGNNKETRLLAEQEI